MDAPLPNWVPLVQKISEASGSGYFQPHPVTEKFVDQAQAVNTVKTVFIGLALMVAAALLAVLFIWSYEKGVELFITILSMLMLAYAIKVVILIYMIRGQLSPIVFQLYIASASAMGLIGLFLIFIFSSKYYRRSSAQQSPYQ
jgi:CHASE2 domain-containing sensor protein